MPALHSVLVAGLGQGVRVQPRWQVNSDPQVVAVHADAEEPISRPGDRTHSHVQGTCIER